MSELDAKIDGLYDILNSSSMYDDVRGPLAELLNVSRHLEAKVQHYEKTREELARKSQAEMIREVVDNSASLLGDFTVFGLPITWMRGDEDLTWDLIHYLLIRARDE